MQKKNENHEKGLTRREAVTGMAVAATTAGALLSTSGCGPAQDGGGSGETAPTSTGNSWVIHGGTVLTMNPDKEIIRDGAVAIKEGVIAAVGPTQEILEANPGLPRRNAKGHAILPGFVNTHCHSDSWMDKAYAPDLRNMDRFGGVCVADRKVHELSTQEDRLALARLGTLDLLKCGVTTNFEIGSSSAEAEVLAPFGIRLVLSAFVVTGENAWGMPPSDGSELIEQWHGRDHGRIQCRLSSAIADMVPSLEYLEEIVERAEALDIGIEMHLGQGDLEQQRVMERFGLRSVEMLEKTGFIGPRLMAGHCVTLNDEEIRILGRTKTNVGHCAYKYLIYGAVARALPQQEAGANITIGCDDQGDYLGSIRAALCLARIQQGQYGYTIMPYEILEWATINGAVGLGMGDEVGSLEVGKRADVITLDLSRTHMLPINHHDVASNIVHYGESSDVDLVMVEGRVLMDGREVKTVDEEEIEKEATERYNRVWGQVVEQVEDITKVPNRLPVEWDTQKAVTFT